MPDTPSESTTRPSLLFRLRDTADADSWQAFVKAYAPLIYSYCRTRGLQDADAADIAQEVLTQVAQSMRTFEYQPERGRFRDWLGTVTRHKMSRFLRRRDRAQPGAGGDAAQAELRQLPAPEADAEWTAEFNAQVLRAALERIRPEFAPITWRAFERVWQNNEPALETARVLNLAIHKVYAAKSRVLKRLRAEILLLADDLPQCVPL
jgi:RNA polymerase sigma-70 factor (ECF subfamily)